MDYQKLLLPLPDNTCGEDAINLTEFDEIVAEIEKGEGVNREKVDWKKIEGLCSKLLSEYSKDLRVVAYYCMAIYQQQSYLGLQAGVNFILELLKSDFIEEIYPRRKKRQNKARAAAILWFLSRVEKNLDTLEVRESDPHQEIINSVIALKQLDQALVAQYENDAPNLLEFIRRLDRLQLEAKTWITDLEAKQQLEQPEKLSKAPPPIEPEKEDNSVSPIADRGQKERETENHPKDTATQEILETNAVVATDPSDIKKALDSAHKVIASVANIKSQQNEYDPSAYYLSRMAKWVIVEELPADKVMPPNPNPSIWSRLTLLEQNEDHSTLAKEIETTFSSGAIFNLTLQHKLFVCLTKLGHVAAAEVVKLSTQLFVSRFPKIIELSFSDGSKFVEPQANSWLSTSEEDNGAEKGEEIPWITGHKKAKALLAKAKESEALDIFTSGISSSSCPREIAYWQFEQAKFCINSGYLEVAIPQLEHLLSGIEDVNASQWDRQFRLAVIEIYLANVLPNLNSSETNEEKLTYITGLKQELFVASPLKGMQVISKSS